MVVVCKNADTRLLMSSASETREPVRRLLRVLSFGLSLILSLPACHSLARHHYSHVTHHLLGPLLPPFPPSRRLATRDAETRVAPYLILRARRRPFLSSACKREATRRETGRVGSKIVDALVVFSPRPLRPPHAVRGPGDHTTLSYGFHTV